MSEYTEHIKTLQGKITAHKAYIKELELCIDGCGEGTSEGRHNRHARGQCGWHDGECEEVGINPALWCQCGKPVERETEAAAMREALEVVMRVMETMPMISVRAQTTAVEMMEVVRAALAPEAGKALLARLQQAEEARGRMSAGYNRLLNIIRTHLRGTDYILEQRVKAEKEEEQP